MNDKDDPAFDPGMIGRLQPSRGLSPVDLVAGALSVIWIGAVLAWVWRARETTTPAEASFGTVLSLLIVFLPLVLIWTAAITLRSVRALRQEARRLQASVEAMRNAYLSAQTAGGGAGPRPAFERRVDEIASSARGAALPGPASFTSRRDGALSQTSADRKAVLVPPAPDTATDQPALALGTPSDMQPGATIHAQDLIRALQFPEGPEDRDGFRALRAALEDRETAKLIRAAQDILTLLSQEGIYTDDLPPDATRPEIWRRFAAGERGRSVAPLGAIRDRAALTLTASRMREDTIFRDAAHHFLRCYDRGLAQFEKSATDAELLELADTRTSRAFMIIGRASGTFD